MIGARSELREMAEQHRRRWLRFGWYLWLLKPRTWGGDAHHGKLNGRHIALARSLPDARSAGSRAGTVPGPAAGPDRGTPPPHAPGSARDAGMRRLPGVRGG